MSASAIASAKAVLGNATRRGDLAEIRAARQTLHLIYLERAITERLPFLDHDARAALADVLLGGDDG